MATFNAYASGDFNSASTWVQGSVPGPGDTAYISNGQIVTVSNDITCGTIFLYSQGSEGALGGRLHITGNIVVINAIVSRLGNTFDSSSTGGRVVVLGTCTSLTINGDLVGAWTSNYIIVRDGNFSACTITINGNCILDTSNPTVGGYSHWFAYLNNTNTTAYDTWIVNGNILLTGGRNGGEHSFFSIGTTTPAAKITINGNVTFTGTVGNNSEITALCLTQGKVIELLVTGTVSVQHGGVLWDDRYTTSVTNTFGLTHGFTCNGAFSRYSDGGVHNYHTSSIFAYRGIVTLATLSYYTPSITTGRGYAAVFEYSVEATVGKITGRVNQSVPVVSLGGTLTGQVNITEIDCSAATYAGGVLVSIGTTTVPKIFNVGLLKCGVAVGIASTVSLAHVIKIAELRTNDSAMASSLVISPGVDISTAFNMIVETDILTIGNFGAWPINGRWAIKDNGSKVYGRDINNNALTMVAQTGDVIPAPADVRLGVPVGSTTGTLVLPQQANVQMGVIYDGGISGTLEGLTVADLVPIAKEETSASIKGKTDQLVFLIDGVKASGGGGAVDLAAEIVDLESILTAIKLKTDILTFTTGVNAVDSTV